MTSKYCNRIERVLGWLSQICIFVGSCLLVFMLVIFGWLVFGRYVLNDTPTWVEQLSLVMIGYIIFLGAAAGVRDNSHLGVSFIRESMPRPIRRTLRLVVDLALCGFGLVMMIATAELVQFGWATEIPMLGVPESVKTFPAAIFGALMFLFSGARVIGRVSRMFGQKAT